MDPKKRATCSFCLENKSTLFFMQTISQAFNQRRYWLNKNECLNICRECYNKENSKYLCDECSDEFNKYNKNFTHNDLSKIYQSPLEMENGKLVCRPCFNKLNAAAYFHITDTDIWRKVSKENAAMKELIERYKKQESRFFTQKDLITLTIEKFPKEYAKIIK